MLVCIITYEKMCPFSLALHDPRANRFTVKAMRFFVTECQC
jgi:hypothetical protein